jgi:hypothetical protein
MADPAPSAKRIRRQVLGRRPSLTPYYTIAEQTATQLVLRSHADANRRVGRLLIGCGSLTALLTPLIIFVLFAAGSQSPGDAFFGVLLSWPFLLIGLLLINGGRAIATTVNTITLDADEQTIVYAQTNRVSRRRSQTLQFAQIDHVRWAARVYVPFLPLAPRRPIVALELVTDEGFEWLIDSATSRAPLEPTAAALTAVLGTPLVDASSGEPDTQAQTTQ